MASNGHAAARSGALSDEQRSLLLHIAQADELPEGLDWAAMRRACAAHVAALLESWPQQSPRLHPAAHLIPPPSSAPAPAPASPPSLSSRFVSAAHAAPDGTAETATDASLLATDALPAHVASQRAAALSQAAEKGVHIVPGDEANFYAAKTRAPEGGSWGRRLGEEEVARESADIARAFESFDEPPFTIQRIAELLLSPSEHASSREKYLSAMRRCLAVTASHASFFDPALTEGLSNAAPHISADNTAPSTAPLFSPIGFLVRPSAEGAPDANMDVPGMELGGADRTTAEALQAARAAGAGGGAPGTAGALADPSADGSGAPHSDVASQGETPSVPVPAAPSAEAVASAPPDAAQNVGPSSGRATAPGVPTVPLGVPRGIIDEVDDGRPAAAMSHALERDTPQADSGNGAPQRDGATDETLREHKRARSDASQTGTEPAAEGA